jgi:hypothetical protein
MSAFVIVFTPMRSALLKLYGVIDKNTPTQSGARIKTDQSMDDNCCLGRYKVHYYSLGYEACKGRKLQSE